MNVRRFLVGLCAFVALLAGDAYAFPPSDNSAIVADSQGSIFASSGWCEDVTNVTENLWLSANVPAEITATELWQIRYVKIYHADSVDTAEPVCIRLGNVFPQTSLTCTSATTSGEYLFGYQTGTQFQVRHPTTSQSAANMTPTLLARAQNAATVKVCVAIYW